MLVGCWDEFGLQSYQQDAKTPFLDLEDGFKRFSLVNFQGEFTHIHSFSLVDLEGDLYMLN